MPEVEEEEAEWMDGPTGALLLDAARLFRPKRADLALPCAYTIVAVLLLTGMRPAEGLGLYVEDIDFERKLIRVRRNRHRRLKTRRSRRSVPLWPQLEAVLRAHLQSRGNRLRESSSLRRNRLTVRSGASEVSLLNSRRESATKAS
jgi:integrase